MARKRLSQAEVAKRLVKLRSLERLHSLTKHRRDIQDELIANLQSLSEQQQDLLAKQDAIIDSQAIRIAELETMVFGKKKRPPTGGTPVPKDTVSASAVKQPRTKESYHRPLPPATVITAEESVSLPDHCTCGGSFTDLSTHERYVEDIPLPELTKDYQAHLVTKYIIARGVCLACGKATSSRDLGGAEVSLGPNVRLLVAHLISVGGNSYQQVVNLLATLYGLPISKSELVGILQTQHQAWLPTYNRLKADIRSSPVVHADETSWPIQRNDRLGYAWVLADARSPQVCYALEQSRGATYAQALFGQESDTPFNGIRITDDYGPYRNPELPGTQQLCWAHLYRCIRDVRHNVNLPKAQLSYVTRWYEHFAAVYQDLRLYLSEPYDEVVRHTQADELWQRVQQLANEPAPTLVGEPEKLTRLKAQLQRAGKDRLFVCLTKDTPCDNNRAERDLRQLVLKRKRSFGSQTHRGATALATILSLCTTTWRTSQDNYFTRLAALAG